MLRLKQVIKFKTDLRKGGRLITSGEECNPADGGQSLTDVGILACGDSYHCVEDPSSRLGGVCAKVFNSGGAVVDIDQGGADKAKRIGTSNSVLVKDKVLQEGGHWVSIGMSQYKPRMRKRSSFFSRWYLQGNFLSYG